MRVLLRKKKILKQNQTFSFMCWRAVILKNRGGREVIYWSVAVVQIEQTLFIIHILFWWIFKQQPYKKHPQKSHTIKESHYSAHQSLPSGGSSGRIFLFCFLLSGNYDDLLVVVDIFRDKIETGMRVDKQRRRRCFYFFLFFAGRRRSQRCARARARASHLSPSRLCLSSSGPLQAVRLPRPKEGSSARLTRLRRCWCVTPRVCFLSRPCHQSQFSRGPGTA